MGHRGRTPGVGLTTAAVRTILGPPDEAGGLAEAVAHRLGEAIRLGLILDGERLPSEARLAEQLGVSTVTLREALAALRNQRLVVTRRGRGGGTVVRAPEDLAEGLVDRLRRFNAQDLRDLGDQRGAVSGAAARLAAQRALPVEVDGLHQQVERLQAATTRSERRRADTQFDVEVAAAAQSPRLTREVLRLRAEVGDLLSLQIDEQDHRDAVQARRALVEAIERREADRARELAERQVELDTARLLRLRLRIHELGRAGGSAALPGGGG
ncbi:MAG TPA: GntR family transcriptional regulator [Actinocrinis sp.]|nr:GntR family transcriptional regulator [Actinocrinis sp.]